MTADLASVALYLLRASAYFATLCALGLLAWRIVGRVFPRAQSSLRLAALGMTYFAVNTIVVEALGLIGWLWAGPYLAVCAILGLAAWFTPGGKESVTSILRLLHTQLRAWARPLPASSFAILLLTVLVSGSLVVEGVDSLSLHGPWIVDMLQNGRLLLQTQFNYPMLMEYQYLPPLMILGSDTLVFVPRLLTSLTALMLVHATGRQLGIPGRSAQMVAWWCVLNPLLWRAGSLKADLIFGVGVLGSLLASMRIWQRHQGGIYLALLSSFLMVGAKATGFVYAALLCGAAFFIDMLRQEGSWRIRWRRAATVWPTVVVLVLPASMQIANLLRTGSPVHPVSIKVAGIEIFPGMDLAGTSILEHAGHAETWRKFLEGAMNVRGPELPVVLLLFLAAGLTSAVGVVRGPPPHRRKYFLWLLTFTATAFLWLLFLRTPWSRGRGPDHLGYLVDGQSLRYALGALFTTYLLAMAFLRRILPDRLFRGLMFWGIPALLIVHWYHRWGLLRSLRSEHLPGTLLLLAISLCLLWLMLGPLPTESRKVRGVLVAIVTLFGLAFLPRQIEIIRQSGWWHPCRQVVAAIDERVPPGSEIAVSRRYSPNQYLLFGRDLRNELRPWPKTKPLLPWLKENGYRFIFVKKLEHALEQDMKRLAKLKSAGWRKIGKCHGELGSQLLELPRDQSAYLGQGARKQQHSFPLPTTTEQASSTLR